MERADDWTTAADRDTGIVPVSGDDVCSAMMFEAKRICGLQRR
jgi:hypothetical protein